MRLRWAGMLMLGIGFYEVQALDIDVGFSGSGNGTARIRIFQVPAKEPLGALKLRLKLKAGFEVETVTSVRPASGPWSQILPQARIMGREVSLWAMAPNIGKTRDSSARLVADLSLTMTSAKPDFTAGDLIDSVILEEAWTPFGGKAVLGVNAPTTGTRSPRESPMTAPVERIHGLTRTLNFSLGKPQRVRVFVADFRGRRIASVFDGKLDAGMHEMAWNGKAAGGGPLPAGTYFLRLEAGTYAYDRKLEVAK